MHQHSLKNLLRSRVLVGKSSLCGRAQRGGSPERGGGRATAGGRERPQGRRQPQPQRCQLALARHLHHAGARPSPWPAPRGQHQLANQHSSIRCMQCLHLRTGALPHDATAAFHDVPAHTTPARRVRTGEPTQAVCCAICSWSSGARRARRRPSRPRASCAPSCTWWT